MNKKILVLGGLTSDEGESEILDNYSSFFSWGIKDVEATYAHFDQLSFVFSKERFEIYDHFNERGLEDYDLIIFRGKIRASSELAYCVSRYCDIKGIAYFNDYKLYRSPTKILQTLTFYELNTHFIKTLYSSSSEILKEIIKKELDLPFILKDTVGSHGNDNYLVRSYEELDEILAKSPDIKFIAQSFFPNKCDYRMLCIGDRTLVIRRSAVGESHLNNTSQGGVAEIVEDGYLPEHTFIEAHRIASELGMGIAGVDLLYDEDTGAYGFLEVNAQPQLATGAFPETKREMVSAYVASLLEDK